MRFCLYNFPTKILSLPLWGTPLYDGTKCLLDRGHTTGSLKQAMLHPIALSGELPAFVADYGGDNFLDKYLNTIHDPVVLVLAAAFPTHVFSPFWPRTALL
jgi:hypothetical protein